MEKSEATNVIKEFIDTYIKCHGEEDTTEVSLDNVDIEAFSTIVKELEKETVSRESYEHEYFLRKEYEVKMDKMQHQLDKIRAEIVDLGQRTMNDNRASGIWACRDIIDKYKAEESYDERNV